MVVSANRYLNEKERHENAKYIWNKLRAFGWHDKSIAGLLGNTHVESGHNPGIWEGLNPNDANRGFGLVQYTPASMILNHASSVGKNPGNMDFQLELIDSDYFGHWIPTANYDFSYSAYKSNSVNLSEEALADAFLKNFERPANQNQPERGQHADYWLATFTNEPKPSGPVIVENGGQIEKAIEWMLARQGKVTYSMAYRNGPNSYDCSSAVFYALKHAGFPIPFVGNTETLYSMEGDLLIPISANERRRGDIFVSGTKGGSNNAYGHTGFALDNTRTIHCSSIFNGIGTSPGVVPAYSGAPVYWYRVAGSNIAGPTPDTVGSDGEEDKNIYIASVNDGKEYIEQPQLVELFGLRYKEETFKDVESPNDLLNRAKDWLATQPLDITSVSLDFLQLNQINDYYKELRAGDVVTVKNEDLNINTRMRIESKTFSLDEPEIGSLDLGRQVLKISDWIANPNLLNTLNTRGGR